MESSAGKRQCASSSYEPQHSLRVLQHRATVYSRADCKLMLSQAVNAFDRLRRLVKVIVFYTSNFIKAVVRNFNSFTALEIRVSIMVYDSGFLDCIDVK